MDPKLHTTLLCLRRGPVAPHWDQTALGQKDVPLDPEARELEARAVETLAAFRPDRVLSSDLERAAATAAKVAARARAPHGARKDLREQRFGAWQGRPWAEIIATEEKAAVAFLHDFTRATPPRGESYPTMRDRVVRAFRAECRRFSRKVVAYVGHAGPIRAVIAAALDLDLLSVQRLRLDPFGLSIVRFQGATANLTLLNHPTTGVPPWETLF